MFADEDEPTVDETTVCEACGQSFPDEMFWQEHYEDYHLGADDDPDRPT